VVSQQLPDSSAQGGLSVAFSPPPLSLGRCVPAVLHLRELFTFPDWPLLSAFALQFHFLPHTFFVFFYVVLLSMPSPRHFFFFLLITSSRRTFSTFFFRPDCFPSLTFFWVLMTGPALCLLPPTPPLRPVLLARASPVWLRCGPLCLHEGRDILFLPSGVQA